MGVMQRASRQRIISRAHEVVQALPLAARQYACVQCGLRGDLATLFGEKRCRPHVERMSSGWLDESTPEERAWLDIQQAS